mmetsp:Transcript_5880/g.18908  ORF Transcript_5880/g.18908 Transcript_5880/m.18908 type:complete len:202 (-) Transcript_5880:592-1197(-)
MMVAPASKVSSLSAFCSFFTSGAERRERRGMLESTRKLRFSSMTSLRGPSSWLKASRSRTRQSVSVIAMTLAARGCSKRRLRSPKYSPGPRVISTELSREPVPARVHLTWPERTMKKMFPSSPLRMMVSPARKWARSTASVMRLSCSVLREEKMETLRRAFLISFWLRLFMPATMWRKAARSSTYTLASPSLTTVAARAEL